jgi:formate dehydrogenase iron-sulfur subunit
MAEIAMLHDVSKCSACRACMVACKQWKELPAEITPFDGSFQSHKDLSPKTFNLIKMKESTDEAGKFRWLFLKFQCMHCGVPGCAAACPVGALTKHADGPVTYDDSLCIGCKYCEVGCPFGVPHVDEATEKVSKCNLCYERIENGMVPACAKTCTAEAILFGTRSEMLAIAEARLEVLKATYPNAQLYGADKDDAIAGTSMLYILTDTPETFDLPANPSVSPALGAKKLVHAGGKVLVGAAAVAVAGAMVLNAVKGSKAHDEED